MVSLGGHAGKGSVISIETAISDAQVLLLEELLLSSSSGRSESARIDFGC